MNYDKCQVINSLQYLAVQAAGRYEHQVVVGKTPVRTRQIMCRKRTWKWKCDVMGWLVGRLCGCRLVCYGNCRGLKVLDRTRWIALVDVSRICRFGGGTSDEDRLGTVSVPYATLFFWSDVTT